MLLVVNLFLITNIYSYSAEIIEDEIIVGGVTCPITTDYRDEPQLLDIEEIKAGILLVNYDQNAGSGTFCLYSEQRTTVIDLKKSICLGDYLRKNINLTSSDPQCDGINQPKWNISKNAIIVQDEIGEQIANIRI